MLTLTQDGSSSTRSVPFGTIASGFLSAIALMLNYCFSLALIIGGVSVDVSVSHTLTRASSSTKPFRHPENTNSEDKTKLTKTQQRGNRTEDRVSFAIVKSKDGLE